MGTTIAGHNSGAGEIVDSVVFYSESARNHFERLVGISSDIFSKGIDVRCVRIFAEEEEQAVAQHRHGGYCVGIAATSLIFQQTSVFAPVVADFDAAPMTSNVFEPLLRGHAVDWPGTEIIAGKTILILFECGRVAPHFNHCFHMREIDVEWVNWPQCNVVLVYSAVGFLRTGKRGERFLVSLAARR